MAILRPARPSAPASPTAKAAPPAQAEAPAPAVFPADAGVRLVAGFAGFGAGSVNLAISSSILAGGAGFGEPLPFLAGGLAGIWGAVLLAATVAFLARGSLAGNRWARPPLGAAAGLHVAAVVFGTPGAPGLVLTQLSALLLTLMVIASLAWLGRDTARRGTARTAVPPATRGPGRLLLGAFAGAVLVAGITTPGLAASAAGQHAVPHGSHGTTLPGNGHHQR